MIKGRRKLQKWSDGCLLSRNRELELLQWRLGFHLRFLGFKIDRWFNSYILWDRNGKRVRERERERNSKFILFGWFLLKHSQKVKVRKKKTNFFLIENKKQNKTLIIIIIMILFGFDRLNLKIVDFGKVSNFSTENGFGNCLD